MSWQLQGVTVGDYGVSLMYNCATEDVGAEIEVAVGDSKLTGTITEAFNPPHLPSPDRVERNEVYERPWKPLSLGTIAIPAGASTLTVRALSMPGNAAMELKSVVLERKE